MYLFKFCVAAALAIILVIIEQRAYDRGFADATKVALRTNPVSEELELACAGLWVGEQNRKYYKKEMEK